MVVIRLDRKVFYGLVVVLAMAVALGAGLFLGRSMQRPAAATTSGSTASNTTTQKAQQPQSQIQQPAQSNAPQELSAEQLKDVPRIPLEDAHAKLGQPGVMFVDARSAGEYQQGHIKGSINLPLADANTRMNELPKDKDLILYCA